MRTKKIIPPFAKAAEKGDIMIYFDNAATGGKKPDSVIRAVTATLQG